MEPPFARPADGALAVFCIANENRKDRFVQARRMESGVVAGPEIAAKPQDGRLVLNGCVRVHETVFIPGGESRLSFCLSHTSVRKKRIKSFDKSRCFSSAPRTFAKQMQKRPQTLEVHGLFANLAPRAGLEPATGWLTATCSTN